MDPIVVAAEVQRHLADAAGAVCRAENVVHEDGPWALYQRLVSLRGRVEDLRDLTYQKHALEIVERVRVLAARIAREADVLTQEAGAGK